MPHLRYGSGFIVTDCVQRISIGGETLKRQTVLFSQIILVGFALLACSNFGTRASAEPVQTTSFALAEESEGTSVPSKPAFEGKSVEAADCKYGGEFESIAAVDEFTVEFDLCYPDVAFLSKVASTSFSIQPAEHLEATKGSPLENPIGTGPYMVESWEHGKQLILKAFPDHWGASPRSKNLVFRWYPDPMQRLVALQSGRVDGIDNVGLLDFEAVSNDPNLQLVERMALNIMYFGFNNDPKIPGYDNAQNPFANEKVRQAIAIGIDRQHIVDNFFSPGSKVATHFTPCAIPNGCVGDPWYDFDPETARVLITEAGYPEGFETKIYYRNVDRSYAPLPKNIVEDLQVQLKENLKIDTDIVEMESSAFLMAVASGQLDGIYLLGWEAEVPDQTNFLNYHFGENASAQFGDKFDDITENLAKAAQFVDNAERGPYYTAANNAIKLHVPMIPVAWSGSGVAYKASAEGVNASPLSDEKFVSVRIPDQDTFVWMQDAEPTSLYCPDETDSQSLRACGQIVESLYGYQVGSAAAEPVLAEKCEPDAALTQWKCMLRRGVKFHDGSTLDANDVVTSFVVQWDASDPLHSGNKGTFTNFSNFFDSFLNVPNK